MKPVGPLRVVASHRSASTEALLVTLSSGSKLGPYEILAPQNPNP